MNIEKINKNLQILQNVADKLIGGQLHPGNVAHDAPTKGYTISNCIKNLKEALKDDLPEEELNEDPCDNCPFVTDNCVCSKLYEWDEMNSTLHLKDKKKK